MSRGSIGTLRAGNSNLVLLESPISANSGHPLQICERRPKQSIRLHGLRLSGQIVSMHADYAPTGTINVSDEEE